MIYLQKSELKYNQKLLSNMFEIKFKQLLIISFFCDKVYTCIAVF